MTIGNYTPSGIHMHEARLYQKLENKTVKCALCNHRCTIKDGNHGICGIRLNENGTLYAAAYGKISSEAVDPIEKKPLFHYLPGTLSVLAGKYRLQLPLPALPELAYLACDV